MILATTIQSEKGKELIKTANEYIFQEFTVKKTPIGQIELYYYNDTIDKNFGMDGKINKGEWLLKFRPITEDPDDQEDENWNIIAQGNI